MCYCLSLLANLFVMPTKDVLSGLWLAGLLLKPQLLIIVVPLIMILRYWKVVYGFFVSSLFLLTISWELSGTGGMTGFINMLMRAGTGAATSSPQYMINWRMAGTLLNQWTNSYFGWIIAGLGTLATLAVVIYLVKDHPNLGSSAWLMGMVGEFCATLAVTWHAHNHMAIVMIPLLLTALASGLLRKRILWIWVVIPVVAWVFAGLIGVGLQQWLHISNPDLIGEVISISAFVTNLILGAAVFSWRRQENVSLPTQVFNENEKIG